MSETTATIQISQNGPYIVSGGLPLCKVSIAVNAEGESVSWQQGKEYPLQESYLGDKMLAGLCLARYTH